MSPAEIAAEVASTLADRARAAIARGQRFALAVPGGSVATAVFPRLPGFAIDWSLVDVTVVDERLVDPSDPASNLGLARMLWLDRVPRPGPRILAPPVALGSPELVAEEWQRILVDALGSPPRLDVALLGVGPDGHVASLFPGHPGVARHDAWAIGIDDAPKPPPRRVTLTMRTLEEAAEIRIVAFGAEKADVLAQARHDPTSTLPVALVARRPAAVRWFLDAAAAAC